MISPMISPTHQTQKHAVQPSDTTHKHADKGAAEPAGVREAGHLDVLRRDGAAHAVTGALEGAEEAEHWHAVGVRDVDGQFVVG
jgi:hypothetical protein